MTPRNVALCSRLDRLRFPAGASLPMRDVVAFLSPDLPEALYLKCRRLLWTGGAALVSAHVPTAQTTHVVVFPSGFEKLQDKVRPECSFVTPLWVLCSAQAGQLQQETQYSADPQHVLSGVLVCFARNQLQRNEKEVLGSLVLHLGGMVSGELCRECTHLIASRNVGADCNQAERMRAAAKYTAAPLASHYNSESAAEARIEQLATTDSVATVTASWLHSIVGGHQLVPESRFEFGLSAVAAYGPLDGMQRGVPVENPLHEANGSSMEIESGVVGKENGAVDARRDAGALATAHIAARGSAPLLSSPAARNPLEVLAPRPLFGSPFPARRVEEIESESPAPSSSYQQARPPLDRDATLLSSDAAPSVATSMSSSASAHVGDANDRWSWMDLLQNGAQRVALRSQLLLPEDDVDRVRSTSRVQSGPTGAAVAASATVWNSAAATTAAAHSVVPRVARALAGTVEVQGWPADESRSSRAAITALSLAGPHWALGSASPSKSVSRGGGALSSNSLTLMPRASGSFSAGNQSNVSSGTTATAPTTLPNNKAAKTKTPFGWRVSGNSPNNGAMERCRILQGANMAEQLSHELGELPATGKLLRGYGIRLAHGLRGTQRHLLSLLVGKIGGVLLPTVPIDAMYAHSRKSYTGSVTHAASDPSANACADQFSPALPTLPSHELARTTPADSEAAAVAALATSSGSSDNSVENVETLKVITVCPERRGASFEEACTKRGLVVSVHWLLAIGEAGGAVAEAVAEASADFDAKQEAWQQKQNPGTHVRRGRSGTKRAAAVAASAPSTHLFVEESDVACGGDGMGIVTVAGRRRSSRLRAAAAAGKTQSQGAGARDAKQRALPVRRGRNNMSPQRSLPSSPPLTPRPEPHAVPLPSTANAVFNLGDRPSPELPPLSVAISSNANVDTGEQTGPPTHFGLLWYPPLSQRGIPEMRRCVIAVTGFNKTTLPTRHELRAVVHMVGACYLGPMSKERTTHLISRRSDGSDVMEGREMPVTSEAQGLGGLKFQRAREWNITIVGARWLFACLRQWRRLPEAAYEVRHDGPSSATDRRSGSDVRAGKASSAAPIDKVSTENRDDEVGKSRKRLRSNKSRVDAKTISPKRRTLRPRSRPSAKGVDADTAVPLVPGGAAAELEPKGAEAKLRAKRKRPPTALKTSDGAAAESAAEVGESTATLTTAVKRVRLDDWPSLPATALEPEGSDRAVSKRLFLLCGGSLFKRAEWSNAVTSLGGALCATVGSGFDPECTHLVVDLPALQRRTEKVLCAVAAGCWLLPGRYLTGSVSTRQFLPEAEHAWCTFALSHDSARAATTGSAAAATETIDERVAEIVKANAFWRSQGRRAFAGQRVVLLGVTTPTPSVLQRLIVAGQGTVAAVFSEAASASESVVRDSLQSR